MRLASHVALALLLGAILLALTAWGAPAPLVRHQRPGPRYEWPVGYWEGKAYPMSSGQMEVFFHPSGMYWERWTGTEYVGTWKREDPCSVRVECDAVGPTRPNHYSLRFERTDSNGLTCFWGHNMHRSGE